MRIDVAFTPAEVKAAAAGRVVVVIDVLRATSTITEALANGARNVLPVATAEDAARIAEKIGRDSVLLCGERDAERIPGFQLGNSPLEFTAERVGGRALIMKTTNGTPAVLAAAAADHCYIGSLLNVGAVAAKLIEHDSDVLLLCAGREGAFALEDAICAGRIARRVRAAGRRISGSDALRVALSLSRAAPTAAVLRRTAAGQRIAQIGLQQDIDFCVQEDRHEVVPVLDEHRIRL